MQEMTVVIVGHVDHGKSTLVGRLLYDTAQVPADRVEFVRQRSAEQGRKLEFAYLLDGLEEEQEQGITIDFTQTQFRIGKRNFVLADAPGHREFLKNMLSGASRADAAILLIDAAEGVQAQSRRHGYLLSLLGVRQIIVVVNKMDLVAWSQDVYQEICREYADFLTAQGMQALAFIPASAYEGDNIAKSSEAMPWYQGNSVMEQMALLAYEQQEAAAVRFPIQDVYRMGQARLPVGRLESGSLGVGDRVTVWPTQEQTTIKAIHCWPQTQKDQAAAGQCIAVELSDPLFVERGMVAASPQNRPQVSRYVRGRIVWLGKEPLQTGRRYKLRVGFQETGASLQKLERVLDIGEIQEESTRQDVPAGFVGEGVWVLDQPLVFESFAQCSALGRFVLVDNFQIAGGGIIQEAVEETGLAAELAHGKEDRRSQLFPTEGSITQLDRQQRNGHKGMCFWFTGLSGSGKSTLARALEEELFRQGKQVYVLDGDNIRCGLNSDLGFSKEERAENIRRIAEVAKLFVDAGFIVITAFISPYKTDRAFARSLFAADEFKEVYVKCSLEICEQRDPKGLYKKARRGELAYFTGVNDVYEEPEGAGWVVKEIKDIQKMVMWLNTGEKIITRELESNNEKSIGD